jgi:hypothetical protein
MATAAAFAATPHIGSAIANATLDTSLTAPTNVATMITGVAAPGTKVEQIIMQALGTTVAGVINLFLFDNTTYHLIDQWLVPVVVSSTTAKAWSSSHSYPNLLLPTNTWSLRFAVTVAGLQSLIKGSAFGGDL